MRVYLLLLLLAASLTAQNFKADRTRRLGAEANLVKSLSSKSSPDARPPVRGCAAGAPPSPFVICLKESADHPAIVVVTSIFINRIDWDSTKGTEVDLVLRQQWEDSRLQYDVDPREHIDELTLPSSVEIWTPDTYITSGRERDVDENRRRVIVEPSGHVRSYEQRQVILSPQTASSSPFSASRNLNIRLSSYKYPLEDVVYLWANSPPLAIPVEVSSDLLSGNLQFEQAVAGDCVGNYTVGAYACIDVTVTFKGSFMTSFTRFFIPTTLLLVFSWLHMWLHASWSVPRSLSACLPFLIFAAIFLFTNVPSYQCCWLFFCLVLSFLSLVEYFSAICCGYRRDAIRLPTHTEEMANKATNFTNSVADASDISCTGAHSPLDSIGRLAFPVVFLIFTLLFAFLF